MKSNLKISLLAGLLLAAGVAYSQPFMGAGQHEMRGMHQAMHGDMMGGPGMQNRDMGKMQAFMAKRHAALKAKLKLTPDQEPAWKAFTVSHQAPKMQHDRQAIMADLAKLSTPERIDKMKELRTQHMGEMSAAMDQRGAATKTFYAALTAEQQKIFDAESLMGRGRARGKPGAPPAAPSKP